MVDGPAGSTNDDVRQFRSWFDSDRAALYHPWVEIPDPTEPAAPGAPPRRLLLPPSGFVAGVHARADLSRGVQRAQTDQELLGVSGLETTIDKATQDVLNPEGINALRFFPGRGYQVWGGRTLSSDPEWRYLNVVRFLLFLEHSIDRGTRWVVFEPNDPQLWANIRRTIEDFLLTQ